MKAINPVFALLVAPALVLLAVACGDDDDAAGEPAATFPAGGDSVGREAEVVEVEMSLLDNWFDPATVSVTGGEAVRFLITNDGAAIHNVRIAGADRQYNTADDAVSDPPLLNAGESAVLEWLAPSLGGTFAFRCDFHPEAMVGEITVERAEGQAGAGTSGP